MVLSERLPLGTAHRPQKCSVEIRMKLVEHNRMVGEPTQIHILSFEGPDDYSRAGGLATRLSGLAAALSEAGFNDQLDLQDPR
jgi:hypothetical protein